MTDNAGPRCTEHRRFKGFRVRLRSMLLIGSAALLLVGLGACDVLNELLVPSSINVTVRNLCSGSNSTMNVYINDSYRGTVSSPSQRTFSGITPGTVRLRAVGTGYYGTTIRRDVRTYLSIIWTLCPPGGDDGGGGRLGLDPEGDDM